MLQPDGIADLAPKLLDQGISDQSIAALKPLINPMVLPLLEAAPGGLRGALVNRLGSQLAAELKKGSDIEVYQQTRSILGSVRHLYRVGSDTAATLILIFSVIVPFAKASLVMWAGVAPRRAPPRAHAALRRDHREVVDGRRLRRGLVHRVPGRASNAVAWHADHQPSVVAFTATFGPGFYWFAAYCVVSLAVQQVTARWIMAARVANLELRSSNFELAIDNSPMTFKSLARCALVLSSFAWALVSGGAGPARPAGGRADVHEGRRADSVTRTASPAIGPAKSGRCRC